MKDSTRISREKKTVKIMIEIYCRGHHSNESGMCEKCWQLYEYALGRVDKCPFHEQKPVCGRCPVHCYKDDMREEMLAVMRHSGPRMLLSHPVLGILHIIDRFKYKADKDRGK
jgi:hypothetical protein